jgi:tRNA(Met) cytidine acetyltransferase
MSREEIEKIAQRVAENLNDYIPAPYMRLLKKLGKAIERAIEARHRRLLVISGEDPVLMGALAGRALLYYERVYRRVKGKEAIEMLYMFHDEFDDARIRKEVVKRIVKSRSTLIELTVARYEESDRYLGTTFQGLVLDLYNDLKPNDVGRLVGIVEGGGLIVLLVPPWGKWDKWMTIFKENLVIPGYREPRHIFISWFKRKLLEHKGVFIYDAVENDVIKAEDYVARRYERRELKIPDDTKFPRKLYELALTQDQVNVIKELEGLVEKPKKGRRKVFVITADRGRGKSCAVGIAVAGLIDILRREKPRVRVLVTAPNATSVQSFFTLLMKALDTLNIEYETRRRGGNVIEVYGGRFSVEYWDPIDIPKLKADIVVVDEAAGIHVPQLHRIWRAHRRLVFATTIHGYEGAGRGFSVRFLSAVKRDPKTELHMIEMHEPIRYAKDDPIERWLFDALLLDAEPAELDEEDIKAIEEGRLEYLRLSPEWLFSPEGEQTLRQLFGIYVLAHYRNEPDDLGILADAPHHIIRALRVPSGKIVCAAQIAVEGGLDEEVTEELLRGGKTPGNIIPDRLLKHVRVRELGRMKGLRIVRIATHPDVQGKGIGSRMLKEIYEEAKEKGYDWVGSGFGVNEQLLNFWLKNGFLPVHMSPDRNPVSGEYTVLVIKPISEDMKKIASIAYREFRRKLIESLYDTYSDLETEVALMILRGNEPIFEDYRPALTPVQIDRLWIYAYGPMTYEAVCDIMHEIARAYWYMYPKTRGFNLSKKEEYAIVARVLQAKSWEVVADELKMRPHSVMVLMKDIARKFLKHFYGIDESSPVGVTSDQADSYAKSILNLITGGLRWRAGSD